MIIRRIIMTCVSVAAVAASLGATSDCSDGGNGDSTPQPPTTTTVGPPGTGKASIIPKDTTVVFPKNQAETDDAVANGATWICGDGGMSFKKRPDACVGHGGPSELVRR
jgi:hypothetical protein